MATLELKSDPVAADTVVVERVALRKLVWVAPLLLIAALIVNSLIRAVALGVNAASNQFMPLAGPTYVLFTIVGALGAVIAFIAVARFSKRPYVWYARIAIVVLLVSFIPDGALLFAASSPPGGGFPQGGGFPAGGPPQGGGFPAGGFPPAGAEPNAALAMGSADLFSVGALMLMHIATGVLCIVLLTRLTRPNPIGRA